MAVKTEQVEKNLVKLTFEVTAEKFEEGKQKAYLKNMKKFNVPGFRKGKVPRAIIEKYYTEAVFYDDAINYVLPEAYDEAVKESGLDIVAKPELDVEEIKKGEPVVFTALVTTRPEVKLGEYKGVTIEKIEHNITDEDVMKELENVQKKNARLISVEDRAVENGDIATIDFEGFVDGVAFEGGKGEEYDLEIGSGTFIPGFEEQVIGVEIGGEKDVNVKFPEEYHSDALAGKDATFKVKVKEIKARELPELNDDFATEVSEFETLDEYKNDLKAKLEKRAENQVKAETENAVIEKVIANAEVDIPQAMIDTQIDHMVSDFSQRIMYQGINLETYLKYTGMSMDTFRSQFAKDAEKNARGSLVLDAVTADAGITIGDEEYEMKLVDMAKQYNMEIDKLKENIGEAEAESIKKNLAAEKTVQMLVNNAVIA
jgi:trigger factor